MHNSRTTSARQRSVLIAALLGLLGVPLAIWLFWLRQPSYALGAVALPALLVWVIRRPLRGVFLSIVIVGLLPQAPQEIGFRELAFLVIWGTTFFAWLCNRLLSGRVLVRKSSITAALLMFLGILVLSLPIALARGTTLYEWARGLAPFVPLLGFFVVAAEAHDARTYRQLLWVFVLVGSWLAGQTIFVYWHERLWEPVFIPEIGLIYRRVTWIFDAATSPLILAGAVIVLVEALFAQGWLKRLAFWGIAFFLSSAIVLTLSRSEIAVLAFTAISTVFVILFKGRLRLPRFIWQALFVGLMITIMAAIAPISSLQEQIQSRVQSLVRVVWSLLVPQSPADVEDINILARLNEFTIALNAFKEQPLLGQGLGYSYEVPPAMSGKETAHVQYVHNIFAYFLMTTGLIGSGILLVLIVATFLVFWHKYRREASPDWDRVLVAAESALAALWLYALFFAVFRTLSFNFVVGVALALLASHRPTRVLRA
jgi:O-antigen ligase